MPFLTGHLDPPGLRKGDCGSSVLAIVLVGLLCVLGGAAMAEKDKGKRTPKDTKAPVGSKIHSCSELKTGHEALLNVKMEALSEPELQKQIKELWVIFLTCFFVCSKKFIPDWETARLRQLLFYITLNSFGTNSQHRILCWKHTWGKWSMKQLGDVPSGV